MTAMTARGQLLANLRLAQGLKISICGCVQGVATLDCKSASGMGSAERARQMRHFFQGSAGSQVLVADYAAFDDLLDKGEHDPDLAPVDLLICDQAHFAMASWSRLRVLDKLSSPRRVLLTSWLLPIEVDAGALTVDSFQQVCPAALPAGALKVAAHASR